MPHFIIEYSANLSDRVDMPAVVDLVRRAAIETGVFPLGGIRVRAIRCDDYAIADGDPRHGFLAMTLRMGQGRDLPTRKQAGAHIFEALSAHLDPVFTSSRFALSFEIVEIQNETSWKRNNLHDYLKAEASHG
ncbi:5-carboxymethyl-2-hydroxymuconate Delta-isomerase [Bradyrhizobium sp. U87765 SZCCT0131]|uniref:5-carboxymethyl-2-hydroxymuconate Delta-isomerase n=1 Tax=unclassified Bradyrhizobium TaxID=2631580 RepID=UPI001BABC399|nr:MULTISPECIES: 5-carboxymethyl-2-hydroxymuconate Delta-isomerase [unclassified Bradyrhizobium]MBR1218258.1 5-carboxymethyl-2-hydroxymuconate Delta-isomerase [Bradyrhizobium sp. U87765 SZCCT0131]MBR1260796.1 5-carboxymethyl-2-hydroxymuconate Delta-isomerase [Bradyrhizobium sp. U87765 SZCCT0134]MBR1303756.1 5-carboxymethyl-2-hydroxymuconate Delta-isomerase [Bradyrhizobium sp. U87765 SZCCT0110]MBR1319362.1 5-carboxymethyl-2-hydroxymuconate Delta-isomerase [Bradyrhizobium sp. U87765 SZCCT0109]MB